jgi:hypothetical protein
MKPLNPLAKVNPGKKGPPGFAIKLIISAAAPVKNPVNGPNIMPESINGMLAKFILSAGYSIGDRDEIDTELRIYRKGMSPVVTKPRLYDPYKKQLEYFLSCLENNEQPKIITPEQNLDVIKAVCAIRKSAETNEVIKIL